MFFKRIVIPFLVLSMSQLSNPSNIDLIINITEAISNVYHFQYYLILSSHESVQKVQHENLLKKWHYRNKFSTTVDIHIDDFLEYEKRIKSPEQWKKTTMESKCLIIFYGDSEASRKKFVELSKIVNFGKSPKWLIFLTGVDKLEQFLNLLTLPFNSQLLLASLDGSKYVYFKAPYRVAENFPLRITDVGKYSLTEGLNLPVIEVATTRRDMEGFRFRAGTWKYKQTVTNQFDDQNKNSPVERLTDIFQEISERLNFTYDEYPSHTYGSMLPNGTWNGLIGMLINKEIDVIVLHLSITKERIDHVYFCVPIISTGNNIFYLDVKNEFEWGNLFRPFSVGVWLVILLWFAVITIALTYFFTAECSWNSGKTLRKQKRECTMLECSLIAFRAFTNQGTDVTPKSLSSRIVLYSAYLTMAVVIPAYSAALISYLTIQTPYRPFDSLETMLEKGTHYLALSRDSSEYSFFEKSKEPLLQNVFQKLVMPLKIKDQHPQSTEDGIHLICRRKDVAYLGNHLMGKIYSDELLRKRGCVIRSLESAVLSTDESWGFPKGSPYAMLIDLELRKMMYKGLIRRVYKQFFVQNKEISNSSGYEEISLRHVVQIYSLLLGGFGLSVFILMIEIFINRRKKSHVPSTKLSNSCKLPKKSAD